jgi:hypothetical protein
VQSTGDEPGARATRQLFYISDVGLRFHVDDAPTATALGVVGMQTPGGPTEFLSWRRGRCCRAPTSGT